MDEGAFMCGGLSLLAAIAGWVAGTSALVGLAWQIRRQRRMDRFAAYQSIAERFRAVQLQALQQPALEEVWLPLPDDRAAQVRPGGRLDWAAMTPAERGEFRYTRLALDVLDEAHHAWSCGVMDDETWSKWEESVRAWARSSRWVTDVALADEVAQRRFRRAFVRLLETARLGG